jgi:hypothetical protein
MVIVMTTRRPRGVSYMQDTLRSIGDVGDRRKMLVSDGPLDDAPPAGWEVVSGHPWRGARATGWWCLGFALESGVRDLLLLQDDIVVCDGGSQVMDECPVPGNCIATTFYSKHALPGLQPKSPGAARFIVIGASGTAQALKIPRCALEHLCKQDFHAAPNYIPDEPHRFDDAMFAFARESPWPHVAHLVPNVVRHVGQISACGSRTVFNQPWSVRRGQRFPGDVMNLPVHERTFQTLPPST